MITDDFSLEEVKKLHFIGIGGIGMSGLARICKRMGFLVSGSDIKESAITEALRTEGMSVKVPHSASNLPRGCGAVVISSAIGRDNPEAAAALRMKIPLIRRARLLAEVASRKKTVAVAGTHGKTTTTSMIAAAMDAAGADSTNVVGGIFRNINSNVKMGAGEYFVAEADESDGSFLYFSPLVACVTNVDNDHMDFYKNMANLKKTFSMFISKVPFYGRAVLCADDENLMETASGLRIPAYTYGLSKKADWRLSGISAEGAGTAFDVLYKGVKQRRIKLGVFGLHNAKNALCAYAAVKYLGFRDSDIAAGLEGFLGVKRRIEFMGSAGGILFYDDYGHHPTEIKSTLSALRGFFGNRRIVVVFQPHRYTRTALLYREFGRCFSDADLVYLAPVYSAGEKEIKGVHSGLILKELSSQGKKAFFYPGAAEAARNLLFGDIVVTLGAGDIWKSGLEIKLKTENFKG